MPEEEQKPFLSLRVCQTCGYWKITNALLDAFALAGGATHHCPNDGQELYQVDADDCLKVTHKALLEVQGQEG